MIQRCVSPPQLSSGMSPAAQRRRNWEREKVDGRIRLLFFGREAKKRYGEGEKWGTEGGGDCVHDTG